MPVYGCFGADVASNHHRRPLGGEQYARHRALRRCVRVYPVGPHDDFGHVAADCLSFVCSILHCRGACVKHALLHGDLYPSKRNIAGGGLLFDSDFVGLFCRRDTSASKTDISKFSGNTGTAKAIVFVLVRGFQSAFDAF